MHCNTQLSHSQFACQLPQRVASTWVVCHSYCLREFALIYAVITFFVRKPKRLYAVWAYMLHATLFVWHAVVLHNFCIVLPSFITMLHYAAPRCT